MTLKDRIQTATSRLFDLGYSAESIAGHLLDHAVSMCIAAHGARRAIEMLKERAERLSAELKGGG